MTTVARTTIDPSSAARARNQRYRAKHRRIDYVPSAAALAAIATWKDRSLDNCTAGVMDKLLLAGHHALTSSDRVSGNPAG